MRIDSGLQGYYYDQGKFQRPDVEAEEAAPAQAAAPVRKPSLSGGVESSTLLSSALSGALWALDGGRKPVAAGLVHAEHDGEGRVRPGVAERVNAMYLENADFGDGEYSYA